VDTRRLYGSQNGGTTWTFLGPTPREDRATSIAFPPDRPNAIAIGTSNSGIFQSSDGGRTWRRDSFTEKETCCL
jgi:hypothetical protein